MLNEDAEMESRFVMSDIESIPGTEAGAYAVQSKRGLRRSVSKEEMVL